MTSWDAPTDASAIVGGHGARDTLYNIYCSTERTHTRNDNAFFNASC